MYAECNLKVDIETGVTAIGIDGISIDGRRIVIPSGLKDSTLTVYTPDGQLILNELYTGEELSVDLPYSGLFIVAMNGMTLKIATR